MRKDKLRLSTVISVKKFRARLNQIAFDHREGCESPEARAEFLTFLKEQNEASREVAKGYLLNDGSGKRCAKRISYLQDELIRAIYIFAVNHVYSTTKPTPQEKIAIVAVGGYGRGTLAPGSDIDLLFLLPSEQTDWGVKIIEYILYMLWDMGFKVGHATRTVEECIEKAKEDFTIRTSILEARYVYGEKKLLEELETQFEKRIVEGTAAEFIEAKLTERDLRHKKSGASRYLVEPNVKDGKGGFRDLNTLFWIGKYYYRVKTQPQLVDAGLFTKKEFAKFKKAEDFLWTVRCHMHFLTGKAEERLSFDIQREMAERLKYHTHGGLLNVERFMKHYFLNAKLVGDLTLIVCSQLEEQQAKSVRGFRGLIKAITKKRVKKIPGSTDFINDNGRINYAHEEIFRADPTNLIRMFKLAGDHDLDFHPDVIQLANRSLGLITKEVRRNKKANKLFLQVLTARNDPETLLRKMNESGVLGKFIPTFRRVVAMMQFSMYHHYTVDEHLIRSVGALSRIENGELYKEHPLASKLLPKVENRTALYVAMLIHDIAKGRREDHSIAGARIAKQICPMLGLSKGQTDLVSWLILEHLTMSNTAQSRDLSDRKTILNFAAKVQSLDRLRYLLILTVCDIRAVGPGVWNGWKGQLLRTLFDETELQLTGGFSPIDKSARVSQFKRQLSDSLMDWPEEERQRLIELPYSSYYLSTDLETQVRQLNFIARTDQKNEKLTFDIHIQDFEEITQISVLAPDHPRLLSLVAGACSSAGANIIGAQIHTLRDGRAFDTFLFNRKFERIEDEQRRSEKIGELICEVLRGKQISLIQSSAAKTLQTRRRAFRVRPKILIDNNLSEKFTVLEVECLDRPGLLSDLAQNLTELNLDIGSAHIVTFGEKAVDTFYVTDLMGHKITAEERQKSIRRALMPVLKSSKGKLETAA